MNPVPLFLIIVTLPLLLGGCGEKPVAETKPELEGVNIKELETREGIKYLKGSDTPYTGKSYGLYVNGQKEREENYKDGKRDRSIYFNENGQKAIETSFKDGKANGLQTKWHENGQKREEINYKDGKWDGLWDVWYKNGQKKLEENYKNGKLVEGSAKYWNSKGEPVDSEEESEAE